MNHHLDNNDRIYQQMRQSLDELDKLFPPSSPDTAYFKNIVHETTERTKKRTRYDLLAFWCVSLAVLSILYFIQSHAPLVYFVVQGLSFLAFALILARKWVSNHDTTP